MACPTRQAASPTLQPLFAYLPLPVHPFPQYTWPTAYFGLDGFNAALLAQNASGNINVTAVSPCSWPLWAVCLQDYQGPFAVPLGLGVAVEAGCAGRAPPNMAKRVLLPFHTTGWSGAGFTKH